MIVTPTLGICGDMVEAVLGHQMEEEKPWSLALIKNKEMWREKAEAGERGLPQLPSETLESMMEEIGGGPSHLQLV